MILQILILIAALIFLVASSNLFVNSSSKIAKQLGISEFIIGLTLVAIGTSTPELFSGIFASLHKEGPLIIGNIMGANVANIALIFGISLLMIAYLKKNDDILHELKYLFFVYLIFLIFSLDSKISNFEGMALLVIFIYYMFDIVKRKKKPEEFIKKEIKIMDVKKQPFLSSINNYLFFIISLAVLIVSANTLINSAVRISDSLNISTKLIGIFLGIGTTFPELSVTIQAARKKYRGILVGDLIGSCIINIALVIGVSSTISVIFLDNSIFFDIIIMTILAFLTYLFFTHKIRNQKILGYSLLAMYILFLVFEFILS
jgi:cation:H+ antiporter